MRVVIVDPRFEERFPYREAVEERGGEVVRGPFETRADLLDACRDATVVVTRFTPIDEELLAESRNLRLVMRNGTGYENIDVQAATCHGVPVSNVPGYGSDEVATHAMMLMLAAARETVYADQSLRHESGWGDRRKVQPTCGGTFGIVGLGRIGRAAVPKARGFDMDVVAYDPFLPGDVFDQLDVERCSFETVLDRSDCVSIHAPLTEQTHHLFSTAEFEAMHDDAVLVNTARGPIVDEAALAQAVETGEIFAAGLDVFETEPPEDSPVFDTERIVCSPHHAAETRAADERCIDIGRAEILRALDGDSLQNVVNPSVFHYAVG